MTHYPTAGDLTGAGFTPARRYDLAWPHWPARGHEWLISLTIGKANRTSLIGWTFCSP